MRKTKIHMIGASCVASLVLLASCSSEKPQQTTQQTTAPAQQQAQQPTPSTQPAATQTQPQTATTQPAAAPAAAPSGKVTGAPTTEKYRLYISNNAKLPVTVSVNGEWVGQWDGNTDVPLESVVQGKNQLTVELQGEPKTELKVNIYTSRGGQSVYLLSLDFNGKTGTNNFTFVAK